MDISPLGKTIAIVLVVVLIFLFPLPYIAKAVNKTVDDLVNTNITEYVDAMRQQGTITKENYEDMIRELDRTGELYDIDIEVSHPVSGVEIKETKLGDELSEYKVLNTSYIYEEVGEIDACEEENREYHNHEEEIRSFAAHTHTDDCYEGHRHVSACKPTNKIVAQMKQLPNGGREYIIKCAECGKILFIATWEGNYNIVTIDDGTVVSFYTGWIDYALGVRQFLWQDFYYAVYNEIKANYGETSPKYWSEVFPTYPGIPTFNAQGNISGYLPTVCPNLNGHPYTCGQVQDETTDCDRVVTSITATNPNQTVNRGTSIITTATATYLDGHVGIVSCSSNFNPNQLGAQTVMLTYYGLVDKAKTTGSKACTVSVTVKEAYKLSSLTVAPISQEVFRYQSPSFTVTANYDNGTSKPVTGYSISNYNSSTLGTQTVTITYTESGVTKSATANVIVRNLTRVCPICYTGYYLDNNDKDPGCPYCKSTIVSISASPNDIVLNKGKPLNITVEATYRNGSRSIVTGWTSNYDPSQVGIQDVIISYQTFTASIRVEVRNQLKTCSICSQEYEQNDDGTDPGCPSCKKTVVSIDATPKVLTIHKHQSLPITVKATFKDGHTEVVNDWASNLMADAAGIYEVMILYQNVTDIITVTVMEDGQIECSYCGLKYLFNDSPKGCPSCYVTLTGMEASLRGGGTKVPYKSKLNLQITKLFKDEHRELTYTGWTVSDYNPGQLGNQTITAHYSGFSDQLDIEVVDELPEVTCPNGHTYYLNADGSDPGCPYCSGTEGKAEALFYFDTTYSGFIIDAIYTNGEYPLKKGDYLKVTIKPRNVSILSKLLNIFTGYLKREYTFGGEVS